MTRRKANKAKKQNTVSRKARIEKLLAAGWIASAAEIPPDAIPVDPERINLGGSWCRPPTYFQALQFTCSDCGATPTWEAEDQRWYYETIGAPFYATAKRCRACRQKEQTRKVNARVTAGHSKPPAERLVPTCKPPTAGCPLNSTFTLPVAAADFG